MRENLTDEQQEKIRDPKLPQPLQETIDCPQYYWMGSHATEKRYRLL